MANTSNSAPHREELHPLTTPDGLMDPRSTAAFLGLSVLTLADMRCKGTGPRFTKAGRLVRYRLSDVQAWLNGRTFENTSEAKGAR